jgi:hypothetical protein
MFKGVSQCFPTVSLLYFGPFNPSHCSPLDFYLLLPIFQYLSRHILISSTFRDVMFYITDALSFSFYFPPSLSSIEYFYYYKHVLHMNLYMIMFVLVYVFIFWIYLPCMRENMWPCLSESGLLLLTWCPPVVSIYFPTTCHYSLWLSNTPLRIYTMFSWSIHQL